MKRAFLLIGLTGLGVAGVVIDPKLLPQVLDSARIAYAEFVDGHAALGLLFAFLVAVGLSAVISIKIVSLTVKQCVNYELEADSVRRRRLRANVIRCTYASAISGAVLAASLTATMLCSTYTSYELLQSDRFVQVETLSNRIPRAENARLVDDLTAGRWYTADSDTDSMRDIRGLFHGLSAANKLRALAFISRSAVRKWDVPHNQAL